MHTKKLTKTNSPQTTISTAQALYHRFYLFYSVRDYPPQVKKYILYHWIHMYIGTTELTLTVRFGFSFLLHIATVHLLVSKK
jgi:hypothetical protein